MKDAVVIKVQFSTSLEWSSAVIRKISHSPFSHVDIVTPDGLLLGASDSPDAPVISGNARGVAIRPANYQAFGRRRIAEVFTTAAIADKFYELANAQLGCPFDTSALHAFLSDEVNTNRNWRADDKWFCSELVTWAFEEAGLFAFTLLVPKDRVSPADLLLLLNPYMNTATFWDTIPGLTLGDREL